MSCAAVLSPIPDAPGTLSVEIAGKRLDVDHPVRADAEIFDHLGRAEAPLLARACNSSLARSRVVHRDAGIDELHEVLVGRDDEDVGAGLTRLTGVSGDDVVGLVAALLDRDHAERRDSGAHQRELRHEFVGRILPVRLVGRVEVAPERVLRLVEDHGEMGRLEARRPVANELQHLGREQPHGAGGQAIGPVVVFLVLADRLIIGAEDKRRAVDEKNMVAGTDRTVGLGHGHHISDAPAERYRARAGSPLGSRLWSAFLRPRARRFRGSSRISAGAARSRISIGSLSILADLPVRQEEADHRPRPLSRASPSSR